jgi:hypothetical protein
LSSTPRKVRRRATMTTTIDTVTGHSPLTLAINAEAEAHNSIDLILTSGIETRSDRPAPPIH